MLLMLGERRGKHTAQRTHPISEKWWWQYILWGCFSASPTGNLVEVSSSRSVAPGEELPSQNGNASSSLASYFAEKCLLLLHMDRGFATPRHHYILSFLGVVCSLCLHSRKRTQYSLNTPWCEGHDCLNWRHRLWCSYWLMLAQNQEKHCTCLILNRLLICSRRALWPLAYFQTLES